MHVRPKWFGVPKRRVFMHTIADIPASVKALFKRLSSTATGPGPIYPYKPLLHLVLPSWLSHVIVLDTDLFLFSDISGLWAELARFKKNELLGVAAEQCPSYQEVRARSAALVSTAASSCSRCGVCANRGHTPS